MVEIAKRDDLFVLAAGQIILAHAADAHAGDPEFVAGRLVAGASQHMARDHQRRHARGDNKGAPGHLQLVLGRGWAGVRGACLWRRLCARRIVMGWRFHAVLCFAWLASV